MQKGTQIKNVLLGEFSQILTELTRVTVSQIEEQSDCLPGIPLAPQAPLLHPPPTVREDLCPAFYGPDAFCVAPPLVDAAPRVFQSGHTNLHTYPQRIRGHRHRTCNDHIS